MKLRDICMSVGLLTIRNGCEYVASPALESAIACGFEVPEVQQGDGRMFEELVSFAAKRAAEVGGFRTVRTALSVGFPPPPPRDGLVYLHNVTELKAAVDALESIADAKGITYVGAAVIVTNGPSAQFADIIKICRVHNTKVVGAATAVTFYDTKLDRDSLDHRALTSAACTLAGDQRLPPRECTMRVGSLLRKRRTGNPVLRKALQRAAEPPQRPQRLHVLAHRLRSTQCLTRPAQRQQRRVNNTGCSPGPIYSLWNAVSSFA
jgi:hypothetical protein